MHPFKELKISLLDNYANPGELPGYEHEDDSGFDLSAGLKSPVIVYPGTHEVIPTGIAVGIPEGFELQIRSRSGLAVKHGLAVLNSPGTIDAGYKGEIKLPLANLTGEGPVTVRPGDRVAQAVLAPVYRAVMYTVNGLSGSDRGEDGFGSTGVA
jgi:dUTP pyrophosphatase